jgi:5-methylcytosine-specific restriction endonuclease McrA
MSKRSRACDISQKVKKEVWKRDNHQCIFCGKYVPISCANAHYIKRSQGGLGIEQNVVTACPECHYKEDFGQDSKLYENYMKNYLISLYEDWDEKNLIYNKWNY